jgi:hypothetical protein
VGFEQDTGSSKNKEKRKYVKNKEGQALQNAKERATKGQREARHAARGETCTDDPSYLPIGMQHGKVEHFLRVYKHVHLY